MDQHLITPVQVLALAFGGEHLTPDQITCADIAAAEERYITPVIGQQLYEQLLAGNYTDLRSDYLQPCLAFYTRALIQARLDIRTGACGSMAPKSDTAQAATATAQRSQQQNLLRQARTLLVRMSRHLGDHADQYPEYDPETDILTRCSTHGGFVQIR